MRLIVAALKITNDLERIGDMAVNLAERVISFREMPKRRLPRTRAHDVGRALHGQQQPGSADLSNAEMAAQVLESDDVVDQYRDRIFEDLLQRMTQESAASRPTCSSSWPLAIWNASPTTPLTLRKTLFSGYAAWMCATAAASPFFPSSSRRM